MNSNAFSPSEARGPVWTPVRVLSARPIPADSVIPAPVMTVLTRKAAELTSGRVAPRVHRPVSADQRGRPLDGEQR
jgi:hypothetical protein